MLCGFGLAVYHIRSGRKTLLYFLLQSTPSQTISSKQIFLQLQQNSIKTPGHFLPKLSIQFQCLYFPLKINIFFQIKMKTGLVLDPETEEPMMVTFIITFEGEEEVKRLSFREKEDIGIILSFDRIRKKILQAYRYKMSGKDSVSLAIQNFYKGSSLKIPIHNPANYGYLVEDMISRKEGSTEVKIHVDRTAELTKRKQREKAIPLQFDSDGSIEDAENTGVSNFVETNTPRDEPYLGTAVVRCFFCHKSSRDSEERRVSGPFYGPFVNKTFAHLMCLLWCSYVYLGQDLMLKGVKEAISISKNIRCSYCKSNGASTYCHTKSCKKGMHYRCATSHQWHLDWVNYKAFCPGCSPAEEIELEPAPAGEAENEEQSRTVIVDCSKKERSEDCKIEEEVQE